MIKGSDTHKIRLFVNSLTLKFGQEVYLTYLYYGSGGILNDVGMDAENSRSPNFPCTGRKIILCSTVLTMDIRWSELKDKIIIIMAGLLVPRNCVLPLLCVLLILQYIPVSECMWNHLHLATKGRLMEIWSLYWF